MSGQILYSKSGFSSGRSLLCQAILMVLFISLTTSFSTQETESNNLLHQIVKSQQPQRVNAPVDSPFYPCSGFNSLNITSVVFSNTPNVWFDASFKITAKVNFDTLTLTNVRIVEYWDLFQVLDFSDDFRKTFKKGDVLVYESPIMKPSVGHQGLWTYNIFFMDGIDKENCLTFSFRTR